MKSISRRLPLLLVLALATVAVFQIVRIRRSLPVRVPPVDGQNGSARDSGPSFSALAKPPDWQRLEVWQETITKEDFERILISHFVTGTDWEEWIRIADDRVLVETGGGEEPFVLRFAKKGGELPVRREWKRPEDLPKAPEGKPLLGIHIAIDAGHIGGKWAKMEERWLVVENHPPVREGDMTILVAKLIQPELEKLGAKVSLVRKKLEPITPLRPKSLRKVAEDRLNPDSQAALQRLAQRLFYRTAEIRARAELVNRVLKPDLVLCLHFNADPWGDPSNPELVDRSHFHLLLNGAYTDGEVALADQRFALLEKLLTRSFAEEIRIGSVCASAFVEASGLPPYEYPTGSSNVICVPGQPYLWFRNLLANRLYQCPVLFYEPYVMNSKTDHPRMVAGDYEGMKTIEGKKKKSIFREYTDAVVDGLKQYYEGRRR